MKIISIYIVILFASFSLQSQGLTSVIKGVVTDEISQSPLYGVNIIVVGTDPVIGAMTDENGEFRLVNVPTGRQKIEVSFVGYETRLIPNLLVLSAKELNIDVALKEKYQEIGAFVVKGESDKRENINKMNTVSSRTISIEEATRFSGSLQDPARMSQNYAGVSGASDDRNDIIIRGNSPTGVLWRLEGIDIPSPNHFSTLGTTGGPISMLNVNNLSNSEFMTGAWTSEYGNALSGVFDLKLRNGNNTSYEHLFQIGVNGFELGSEGPFKKDGRASYMFNYRYSTLGVFNKLGIDLGTGAAIPEYQDLTMKLNFPTKKAGTFAIFGVGGFSNIDFDVDTSATNLFSGENEASQFLSSTGIIGASHKYFFDNSMFYKITVSATGTNSNGKVDSVGFNSSDFTKLARFDRSLATYSAHIKLNKKVNVRNNWSAGLIGKIYAINFVDSSKRIDVGSFVENSRFKGNAGLFQGYFSWQHNFSERFIGNFGAQAQYFALSNSTSLEPRIGLKYDLTETSKLSYGFGMHSQTQPVVVYFVKDQNDGSEPNEDLDFSRSIHNVIGYEIFTGENSRLKAEVYAQYIYNVPIDTFSSSFSMLNEGADFTLPNRTGLINEGTGLNYGLELTFEKFLSKGFYYLVTGSIFKSTYKGSDGIERNTVFNNNYVFNALAGKEFKLGENSVLTFDTKVTFAGGRAYTPIDLQASQLQSREIRRDDEAFSENYQPYFRLDFKVGFRYNQKNISHEFMFDIQNITNQKNIFAQGYKASEGTIKTNYQRGFFPVALYRLYF